MQPSPVYLGQLAIGEADPHSGSRFIRIAASARGAAHLYLGLQHLQAGKWYRISLWARGGAFTVRTYDYFQEGPVGGQVLLPEQSVDLPDTVFQNEAVKLSFSSAGFLTGFVSLGSGKDYAAADCLADRRIWHARAAATASPAQNDGGIGAGCESIHFLAQINS